MVFVFYADCLWKMQNEKKKERKKRSSLIGARHRKTNYEKIMTESLFKTGIKNVFVVINCILLVEMTLFGHDVCRNINQET